MIGSGVMVACIIGADRHTVSAEGPQRMSIVHAAQPAGTATVKGFTRPAVPIAGSTAVRPQPVLSAPGRTNRASTWIRPNRGTWQVVPQSGGTQRSWEVVPKGVASENGGSWVVVPKGSDAATSGTKSPGFGKTPPTKGFPEPNTNAPQNTSPSSLRVRAPEANPPSTTRVRAPEAPHVAPGAAPNPGPGSQNPTGTSGPPSPTLGDWVAAAGAIAGMASGMMSYGDAGYADACYEEANYGGTGSSYEDDGAASTASYEADAYTYPVDAAAGDVPSNPLPAARMHVAIVNPTENEVALQFLLDGQPQTLEAGMRIDFTVTRPVLVKFDRGEPFGVGRYRLDQNLYTFRPTDHGWELYRSPYVAPAQQ
jgi:hypothetical protein